MTETVKRDVAGDGEGGNAESGPDQGGTPPERKSGGLAPFRRRRPYDIVPSGLAFDVHDSATSEFFGAAIAEDPEGSYRISEAGPTSAAFEWNRKGGGSGLQAADVIWRTSYPIKSRAWLAMRGLVHEYDWALNLASIVARVAVIGAVAWFVLDWVGFFWQAREIVQEIVLRWLESVRDNSST